ncbi:Major facilitator superfamily transporter [Candidatus Terasakiella magnetica]|uniref:Major facilitator superfamily transporter n=1 Tax=Candidatus Terasakiella magnetica TaxID=1867952 RepID=A0A1C3RGZ6_9PROT|nr:MFS transporter [Candidatus Terasakiella magnetica]SCA56555.1 Major facilitator superfamily transporter [Candidatus Terasakiella magnetica]
MSVYSKSSTTTHKALYALPAFVLAFPTIPVFVLLPSFYGETVGLGLATVGSVLLLLRLFDVISDPLLGWISDHIPARFGKRKLPIAIGGLIGAPALIALFTPPDGVGVAYLFTWGLLLYLAWTAIQIPYLSWAAELEPNYHERTRLNGFREGAGLVGILAIGGLGIVLSHYEESTRLSYTVWITVCIGFLVFTLSLWQVPEGRTVQKIEKFSFPSNNKVFLRVLSAWFLNGLANGLPAVCLPLFLTYILGATEETKANLLFVYFLFAILGIPLWLSLAKRFSKHKVWCISMLGACVVFAGVPFLGIGDVIAFGIICALTGLALGSDLSLPPSIQADCADWDRFRFNKERLATLFSYWSMATKLALGLAVGIAFPILDLFDLSSGSPASKTALMVIYAGLPIVLKIGAVLLMWGFPLTHNKHRAVQHALEKRI